MGIQIQRFRDENQEPKASLNYLARDYNRIKEDLLGRIEEVLPEWKDRTEADFGVALVELFASMGDVLSWYQDRIARESFLHTAEDVRSVLSHLRLIGYELHPAQPATVGLRLLYDKNSSFGSVVINPGDRFSSADPKLTFEYAGAAPRTLDLDSAEEYLEYRNDYSLFTGEEIADGKFELEDPEIQFDGQHGFALKVGAELWQRATQTEVEAAGVSDKVFYLTKTDGLTTVHFGEALPQAADQVSGTYSYKTGMVVSKPFFVTQRDVAEEDLEASDGQPAQAFVLKQSKVLPDAVEFYVNDVAWTLTDSFAVAEYDNEWFSVELDENEIATVRLGDGVHGRIPNQGAPVRVVYRYGGGEEGNVAIGAINKVESATDSNVFSRTAATILQENPGSGGSDRESVEEAIRFGPAAFRSQERAVTAYDYRALLEAEFRGSKVRAQHLSWNKVAVFFAPSGGIDPGKSELRTYAQSINTFLHDKRTIGVELKIQSAKYVPVHVAAHLTVDQCHYRDDIRYAAEQAILGILDFDRNDFESKLHLSRLYEAVEAIEGVESLVIQMFARQEGLASAPSGSVMAAADVTLSEGLVNLDEEAEHIVGDLSAALANLECDPVPSTGFLTVQQEELFLPGEITVFASGGF